ncbi:MAG: nucleotidyltransferase substrate binding protein [Kiritimatiellae bacterium]|jgi:nucleotidyltransferase substrate binding protein (TIGR01987 family)|nr:nucleotidyltransferase substrate binding protein [Kiritimatiellia bacterium]
MSTDLLKLLDSSRKKLSDAVELVQASLNKVEPYDLCREYTPDEREPYDALCDRFIRAVEVSLKFFRTYEKVQFAEESDTFRDMLNRAEKSGLISAVELWFRMRDVRNRIVHDYLPEKVKEMYDDITGPFGSELLESARLAKELSDKVMNQS